MAVEKLRESIDNWDYDNYEFRDFELDRALRKIQSIPEKEIGNAPYEDWVFNNLL